MSLDGILYPMIVEKARLKLGLISTHNVQFKLWVNSEMQLKIAHKSDSQLQCLDTGISCWKYFSQ